MNRSQFYSTAALHYLAELEAAELTSDIDAAIARIGDSALAEAEDVAEGNRVRLADFTADDEW